MRVEQITNCLVSLLATPFPRVMTQIRLGLQLDIGKRLEIEARFQRTTNSTL